MCFSHFSIAITSLGKERAGLCAFRVFVSFARVDCVSFLFLLVSEIGCDVTVVLPGLFHVFDSLIKWSRFINQDDCHAHIC